MILRKGQHQLCSVNKNLSDDAYAGINAVHYLRNAASIGTNFYSDETTMIWLKPTLKEGELLVMAILFEY